MTASERTRRTALGLIGSTVATAGLTTTSLAQENETDDGTDESDGGGDGETGRRPIILAGRTEYWLGIAPEAIEGTENPRLNLEAGREYELVWINVDGAEHELLFESEGGEELAASESSETAGGVVSMTFEASEEMAEYYCEYHPDSMRGGVEFEGGFDLSPHGHDDGDGHRGGNETGHESGGSAGGY